MTCPWNRDFALASTVGLALRMWTLWPMLTSWLAKAMVKAVSAGAARQEVLNAIPRALIRRAGPAGAQFAAGEAAAPADASVGRAGNAAHAPPPPRRIIPTDA